MPIQINHVAGIAIIVINLIPFLFRKPKLLLLTSVVSLLILLLLVWKIV